MLALLASACVLLPSLYWWPQALASKEMRKDLITTFCSAGVKEGEMLESASPSDPLFWMIHPLLDRMLVAKRLAAVNNMHFGTFGRFKGFEDETWLDYSAYTSDSCVSRLRTLGVFARSNKPTAQEHPQKQHDRLNTPRPFPRPLCVNTLNSLSILT